MTEEQLREAEEQGTEGGLIRKLVAEVRRRRDDTSQREQTAGTILAALIAHTNGVVFDDGSGGTVARAVKLTDALRAALARSP